MSKYLLLFKPGTTLVPHAIIERRQNGITLKKGNFAMNVKQ